MTQIGFAGASQEDDHEIQYYVRLYNSANQVYDVDSSTFVSPALAVAPDQMAEEIDYGVWRLSLPTIPSGSYYYVVLDKDLNIVPELYREFDTADSGFLVDSLRETVMLWEHHGGFNALQIVTEEGDPVDGAVIAVLKTSDYEIGDLSKVVGATSSNYRGYWAAPVLVNSPGDYTLLISAPGVIQNITANIIVP